MLPLVEYVYVHAQKLRQSKWRPVVKYVELVSDFKENSYNKCRFTLSSFHFSKKPLLIIFYYILCKTNPALSHFCQLLKKHIYIYI